MAPYNPTWFEAPVPPQRISDMVEVARRSPVPVACGEDYYCAPQFAELLAQSAVRIIQLEPQYLGMSAAKQVCGMVNAVNGVTAPHSAQGPLCSLVCAHLNTATPNFFIHEIFDEFNDDWSARILTNPAIVQDGYIALEDDRIGWGTDLNYAEIAQHPYNENNFLPLFRSGWERRKPVVG
jgi:galactonate dehydratase